MQSPQMPHIEASPVELRIAILRSLPDTSALYKLIKSSRKYYDAYIGQEHAILFQVLLNDMGPEVLLDAFTTIPASRISKVKWFENVESLFHEYADQRKDRTSMPKSIKSITLSDLKRISATHLRVKAATTNFHHSTLCKHPITGTSQTSTPLSGSEKTKIFRAFYRHELFMQIVPDTESFDVFHELRAASSASADGDQRVIRMFKAGFEYYEHEEIRCVRDYYFQFYSAVFENCWEQLQAMLKRQYEPQIRGDCKYLIYFYLCP